jgi:PAS domain S-box-containing protein
VKIRHAVTGEWRHEHLRSTPRVLPDSTVVWDGIYLDISDHARVEEQLAMSSQRLALAQQAAHIGVFDWNIQTNEVIWNEEEERIFGLAPRTFEGTLSAWVKRVAPQDAVRVRREVLAALHRRDREMTLSHRVVLASGETRWIDGAAQFSYDNGKPVRMVGVNIDVTKRHETEAALRVADRRKNEFLAMLSHELRNPLAAITNALQLAQIETDPEMIRWSNDVVQRQVAQLTRLVDDLLDVTRITSGKIQLQRATIDVAEVIDAAVGALRPLFKEHRHSLETSYRRGELWVNGDAARLQQVVVNLLTNAARYTPDGGRITLAAAANGEIVLTVRDNGSGIPAAALERIFELFAQGATNGSSNAGLGIGLTIAKSIVQMHGGDISARSGGAGKGAEFVVTLPMANAAETTSS